MTMHKCPDCHTRQTSLAWAKRDVRDVARKLARTRRSRDVARLKAELVKAKQDVSDAAAKLEEHEMACEFVPEAPMPIRGTGAERGRKQRKPKPGAKVAANRAARMPDRAVLAAAIAEQPLVTLPRYVPPRNSHDPERPPSRLDAGSECKECGKWLPGERSLCGRCLVHRGNVVTPSNPSKYPTRQEKP